jgi:hypothetical protein
MSFTLDKRILRTLIAVVGLIASGAVIAECPDPAGRWVGTFQTYFEGVDPDGDYRVQSEQVWAVRLRADGTMKLTIAHVTPTTRNREEWSTEGIWKIDMMTGSCMLELWVTEGLHAHSPEPYVYGPFVDRRTVKAVVFHASFGTLTGQGTLHKVSFLR